MNSLATSGTIQHSLLDPVDCGGDPTNLMKHVEPEQHDALQFMLWAYGMTGDQLYQAVRTKEDLLKSMPDEWPWWRRFSFSLVVSWPFNFFCVVIVAANAFCLAVKVSNLDVQWADTASSVFVVWFVIETLMRFFGKSEEQFHTWGWLLIDVVLLTVCVLAYLFDVIFLTHSGERGLWNLLALRLFRLFQLNELFSKTREFTVITEALADVWLNLATISVFAGVCFLVFSVVSMAAFQERLYGGEQTVEFIADTYFDTFGDSYLTAFSVAAGGIYWGDYIVEPLQHSPKGWVWLRGQLVLALALFFPFCMVNLVLGVFVKEVLKQAASYDEQQERLHMLEGDYSVEQLQKLLSKMDLDDDGNISREELAEAINELGPDTFGDGEVGASDLLALHAAIDTEEQGTVQVGELLFGVLKLLGSSKSLDIISLDYRQKMLLREMAKTERAMLAQLNSLSTECAFVEDTTQMVSFGLNTVNEAIFWTEYDLRSKLKRLESEREAHHRLHEHESSWRQILENHEMTQARKALSLHLQTLQIELEDMAWQKCFTEAWASTEPDNARIFRDIVRELLTTDLQPWLERTMGGVDHATELF